MVSTDVKSLFTIVLLHHTIDIIPRRINKKNEIVTSITKNEMKEMLILCTKKLFEEYSSENAIYTTLDEQNEPEHTAEKKHRK